MMCINRTIVFMCDSINFADCPAPRRESLPPRSHHPFFIFSFSLFSRRTLQDDSPPKKRILPPSLSLRVSACKKQQHFVRCDAPAFGVVQAPGKRGGGRASPSCMPHPFIHLKRAARYVSKSPPAALLPFSFSLSFSMERTTNAPPLLDH